MLEWVGMLSSRVSSRPGIELAGRFFTTSATWKDPTLAELDQKLESVTEHGELFISEVELCAR